MNWPIRIRVRNGADSPTICFHNINGKVSEHNSQIIHWEKLCHIIAYYYIKQISQAIDILVLFTISCFFNLLNLKHTSETASLR